MQFLIPALSDSPPAEADLPAADPWVAQRMALVRALDMDALWEACVAWIGKALPCHSFSLLYDIDGYRPQQGRHYLAEARDAGARLVTSLDVAAPYLDANPRIPWYTYSQIASGDGQAEARLRAQDPAPAWRDFVHLAFWGPRSLEAVLSIRLHPSLAELGRRELALLQELYPLLEASLQRIRAAESERAKRQTLEALVHELPIAAVLVDAKLVPFYMSAEARRICRTWSEEGDPKGRLPRAIELPLRQWLHGHGAAAAGPGPALGQGGAFEVRHAHRKHLRLGIEVSSAARASGRDLHHMLVLTPVDEKLPDGPEPSPQALALLRGLSPSERKVALLAASGLSNEEIAARLSRSRKTIESQLSSAYRKLNVSSRTQLARLLS